MALDLPRYYLIFDRAVKLVPTEDGGCQVMVYNKINDSFDAPPPSLVRYVFFPNDEAELVTEAEFNDYIEELRVVETIKTKGRAGCQDEP
jgi:hypothetical protein